MMHHIKALIGCQTNLPPCSSWLFTCPERPVIVKLAALGNVDQEQDCLIGRQLKMGRDPQPHFALGRSQPPSPLLHDIILTCPTQPHHPSFTLPSTSPLFPLIPPKLA